MDGLAEGARSGLSEAEYGRVVGKAIGRLRQLDQRSLGSYTRNDIACATQIFARCDLLRMRLREVREWLNLSSIDSGYRLALAVFQKAHQNCAKSI